jgi:hypothetical protein
MGTILSTFAELPSNEQDDNWPILCSIDGISSVQQLARQMRT